MEIYPAAVAIHHDDDRNDGLRRQKQWKRSSKRQFVRGTQRQPGSENVVIAYVYRLVYAGLAGFGEAH
ncbi:hypothetical protein D3C78_976140 [compost metagenome]